MSFRTIALIVAFGMLTGSGVFAQQQQQRKPKTHVITIAEMRFTPPTLAIAAGDIVVWVNKDIVAHTATASPPGAFDSKTIAANGSWSFRFRRAGTFAYVCTLHPTMTGTLQVK